MDTLALIELANTLGRTDAAAELQRRFNTVNAATIKTLWNESISCFQNKLSNPLKPINLQAPVRFSLLYMF